MLRDGKPVAFFAEQVRLRHPAIFITDFRVAPIILSLIAHHWNIAHQLALLDVPVQLISVFGNDIDGDWLKKICTIAGLSLDASLTKEGVSGKYTGILTSDGSLFLGFLTNPANQLITPEHLEQNA